MEMCPTDVVAILMPKRDNDNRLIDSPIIELNFEKDILDPYIIIGGESIQLRMKKENPTLCERCLQLGHPKKFCKSNRELCRDCTEPLQEGRAHNCERFFASTAKNPTRQETIKYIENIQQKLQSKIKRDQTNMMHTEQRKHQDIGEENLHRSSKERGTRRETTLQITKAPQ